VEQVDFSEDGRWLYYAANMGDIDRRDLWRVPVAGGTPENLTNGAGIETWPAVLPSGETVAVLYADARQPQTVAVLPADGGQARTIRALPDEFPRDRHVVPENVVITAEDGLETNNQLFLPPDLQPGERRPAVIFIHGGSRRQMLLGYHYRHFYHMAYAYNQYLANRGYVVLSVNYRSGIGYGRAFRNADDVGRRGNAEYRDIIAAGRYLQGRASPTAACSPRRGWPGTPTSSSPAWTWRASTCGVTPSIRRTCPTSPPPSRPSTPGPRRSCSSTGTTTATWPSPRRWVWCSSCARTTCPTN
jgi:dipeptidyl aminopeptidase/acylaminoacyl peptidase